MNIDRILDIAIEKDASDVHLIAENKPILRIARDLVPIEEMDVITPEDMYDVYDYIIRGNVDKDRVFKETKKLQKLKILGNEIENKEYYDFGKIVIITKNTNITGKELSNILRDEYKIELEMASINYTLAMTSICDKKENFTRVLKALEEIDKRIEKKEPSSEDYSIIIPKKEMKVSEAIRNKIYKLEDYKEIEGKISKEYIWVYPPGIPLITPGEVINKEIIKKINEYQKANIEVRTTFDKFPKIEVLE